MILDKSLVLCDAKTLSISGAASNISTVLDLGAGVDTTKVVPKTGDGVTLGLGGGDADCELFLVVTCTTACTGTGTLNIQLRTHTATITTGVGTVLWETGALDADVVFVAGKSYKLRVPRGLLRYVALEFAASASESVGTFDASLVKSIDTNNM